MLLWVILSPIDDQNIAFQAEMLREIRQTLKNESLNISQKNTLKKLPTIVMLIE